MDFLAIGKLDWERIMPWVYGLLIFILIIFILVFLGFCCRQKTFEATKEKLQQIIPHPLKDKRKGPLLPLQKGVDSIQVPLTANDGTKTTKIFNLQHSNLPGASSQQRAPLYDPKSGE